MAALSRQRGRKLLRWPGCDRIKNRNFVLRVQQVLAPDPLCPTPDRNNLRACFIPHSEDVRLPFIFEQLHRGQRRLVTDSSLDRSPRQHGVEFALGDRFFVRGQYIE